MREWNAALSEPLSGLLPLVTKPLESLIVEVKCCCFSARFFSVSQLEPWYLSYLSNYVLAIFT